jgi:hypothetical protein
MRSLASAAILGHAELFEPSFSSQSLHGPYAFNAIRSGPTGQEVYHARRLIVAPAVVLHVGSGSLAPF